MKVLSISSRSAKETKEHDRGSKAPLYGIDRRFRLLLDTAEEAIAVIQDGRFSFVNNKMMDMTGYNKDDLVFRSLLSFVAPIDHVRVNECCERILRGHDAGSMCAFGIICKDGSVRRIKARTSRAEWDGKPAVLGLFMDIGEFMDVEGSLGAPVTVEQHLEILETAPIGFFRSSPEGKFLYANPAIAQITGYSSPEELIAAISDIGKQLYDHPDEREQFIELLLKYPGWMESERQYRHKGGQSIHVRVLGRAVKDRNGKLLFIEGFVEDITGRKALEDAFFKTNKELKAHLEQRIAELHESNERLLEMDAALKGLLRQTEEDRKELEETIVANIKSMVAPYLDKLKRSRLSEDQKTTLSVVEAQISKIVSPFITNFARNLIHLTPMEMHVAGMIREGRSTKDIADLLCVSENAVLFHRHNIRKKLDIKAKETNLTTFLQSMK